MNFLPVKSVWIWFVVISIIGAVFFKYFSGNPRPIRGTLDGKLVKKHPRIILPGLRQWQGKGVAPVIKKRMASFSELNISFQSHCESEQMLFLVSCWLATSQAATAEKLLDSMANFNLVSPEADETDSNAWELALAYDLFYSYLAEKDQQKQQIEKKIAIGLTDILDILDGDSASLWHSRSSHAAMAWICAIVLPDDFPEIQPLRKRAQAYFLEAIEALSHTEIWPEGYNYWIQNRAFPFALAANAYVNGLEEAKNSSKILQLMRTVGFWHVYATRPDNRIEGFGDEGSRVDLKDETKRIIDLIVGLTRDPVLAGYADYLQQLHGLLSYYHGYQWGLLLFTDPTVESVGDGSLASLAPFLDNARIFGINSTNYAYFRSGWKENDTFISFRAGHSFAHHGHYDAGHFTVFKEAPLAVNSSVYNQYYSKNRLNYSIRTVAKNSLLVLRPGETVRPNWFFLKNVADGGQRIIQPTGSSIISLDHWFKNFNSGLHFEGATLLNYAAKNSEYNYISVDLTGSYNNTFFDDNQQGGKLKKITRQFVYFPKDDQIVVYDHVVATHPEYTKKWLLHTVKQPRVNGLKVLKGSRSNGILESKQTIAIVQNQQSYLKVTRIMPEEAVIRVVGGKDYRYYVEADGDDKKLDGSNFEQGGFSKPWFDNGNWRLEIQPSVPSFEDEFLVVLSVSTDSPSRILIKRVKTDSKKVSALIVGKILVVFVRNSKKGEMNFSISNPVQKLMVFGLNEKSAVKLSHHSKFWQNLAENGVASLPLNGHLTGKFTLTIK